MRVIELTDMRIGVLGPNALGRRSLVHFNLTIIIKANAKIAVYLARLFDGHWACLTARANNNIR